MSGHIDLSRLNWGNYDLVVINESHNFRNGGEISGEDEHENRYLRLLNRVIRTGVRTKVLMLSATPVNNRFYELRNQLALAYEGDAAQINEKLNTSHTIDEIFRSAQRAFNAWSKLPAEERTTDALLKTLDFDFFEVLDSVTIARSRRHIEKYYSTTEIGKFPELLKPISRRPNLTDLRGAIKYNDIYEVLMMLNLAIYTPSNYILPSKMAKYIDMTHNKGNALTQRGREEGIRRLMSINLFKNWLNYCTLHWKRWKNKAEDGILPSSAFNVQICQSPIFHFLSIAPTSRRDASAHIPGASDSFAPARSRIAPVPQMFPH